MLAAAQASRTRSSQRAQRRSRTRENWCASRVWNQLKATTLGLVHKACAKDRLVHLVLAPFVHWHRGYPCSRALAYRFACERAGFLNH